MSPPSQTAFTRYPLVRLAAGTARLALAAVLSLAPLTPGPALAETPVWRVSDGERHLYLGGTIHVLTPSDYPLPAAFERAYGDARRVVLETDVLGARSPEFQQRLLLASRYQDGGSIERYLSEETASRLRAYLESRGIPPMTLLPLKPGILTVTLTILEMQRLGLMGTGVDEHFAVRSTQDGKDLGFLESIDAQIDFLLTLGEGEEDTVVAYTLDEIERLGETFNELKAAWRSGDLGELQTLALAPIQTESPAAYDLLLVKRNQDWMPRIEEFLESDEPELVLVGALHLVGEDGLLTLLESRGYAVEQLTNQK